MRLGTGGRKGRPDEDRAPELPHCDELVPSSFT
jgi:hypothetical protein